MYRQGNKDPCGLFPSVKLYSMTNSYTPFLTFQNQDKMPSMGLGTWKSGPGEVYKAVREAIRIGYRHFDCAARYENEEEIGTALADAVAAGEVSRADLWITTKLWNNAHQEKAVLPAIRESLAKLQLDYLDLYLMHWPVALKPEIIFPANGSEFLSLEEVPLMETWRALEAVHDAGLCRHLGVSNFSIKKLKALQAGARIAPEMNQVESHPYLQQTELLAYCKGAGIHLTAYCPLGSMDRPARVKNADDPILLDNPRIREIAEAHACTPAQVLIRWSLQRGTSVIPKSVNPKRLQENFESQQLELSAADMEAIATLDRHHRYINGNIWTPVGSPYTLASLWDEGA